METTVNCPDAFRTTPMTCYSTTGTFLLGYKHIKGQHYCIKWELGSFFPFFFLGALPFKHPHFSPRMWRDIMNTQTVLKVTNNRMFFFSSLSPNAPKITCVVVTFYILKTFERKHFHMQHFHPFNCRPFDTPSIGIRWNLHKLNSTLRPPVNISKDVHFFISLLAFQSSQRHGRDRTPPQIDSKAPPLTEWSSSTHVNRVPGHQDSILLFN